LTAIRRLRYGYVNVYSGPENTATPARGRWLPQVEAGERKAVDGSFACRASRGLARASLYLPLRRSKRSGSYPSPGPRGRRSSPTRLWRPLPHRRHEHARALGRYLDRPIEVNANGATQQRSGQPRSGLSFRPAAHVGQRTGSIRTGSVVGAANRTHGQRARVAEFQRPRLLRAAVGVAFERSYEQATVSAIVHAARMSRKTFYEFFDSCEDCYLAVCEDCLFQLASLSGPAYQGRGPWRERVRRALASSLGFLESEREMGLLTLGYLLGAAPKRPELRARALGVMTTVLQEGGTRKPRSRTPPAVTAEILLGGVLMVVHNRLSDPQTPLTALVNPLMSMIVLPYLGADAAAAELDRTLPTTVNVAAKALEQRPDTSDDMLDGLEIRLTYRTASVMAAIADCPGLSNLEVAVAAGVKDQGQISKMLARLAGLGIIENTGAGQLKGAANAWHLTRKGDALCAVFERHSARGR
jgi:AcrR family transcriptional regulator